MSETSEPESAAPVEAEAEAEVEAEEESSYTPRAVEVTQEVGQAQPTAHRPADEDALNPTGEEIPEQVDPVTYAPPAESEGEA